MAGDRLRAIDPKRIGGYRLESRLGEGGQGVVYLGYSESGRKVAIKVIHARLVSDRDSAFSRELAAARQVAEFCTVRIIDAAIDHDPPYIVTEYVEGPSLQEVIESEGVRTGAALHRLAIATITALAAIHRAGVVHRDFKPGNVLIGPDGPRVIDFGIARLLESSSTTGKAAGSLPYMAPEHFSDKRVGAPADIFAWGSTIVFAATGRPPFGNDHFGAVAYRILHKEPDLTALPAVLREVVSHCLAKDPAARPTANEVLLRLLNRDHVPGDAPGDVPGDVSGDIPGDEGTALAQGAALESTTEPIATAVLETRDVSRRRLLVGGTVVAALLGTGATMSYLMAANRSARDFASSAGTPAAVSPSGSAAGRSRAPSPSPSRTASAEPPTTPSSLAAAIDAAVAVTPCADFVFDGGFAESMTSATAKGRLVHDGETGFEMQATFAEVGTEQVVVLNRTGYAIKRGNKEFDLFPEDEAKSPPYAYGTLMVVATASVLSILELLSVTRRIHRKGSSYSGSVPVEDAPMALQALFEPWLKGQKKAGYLTYTVTIDANELPTKMAIVWKFHTQSGFYDSTFTTKYRNWRSSRPIPTPG